MNKLVKVGLAIAGLQAVAGATVAVRHAKLKKAVSDGQAMVWIKEVVGDIPVSFERLSPTPAYLKVDKSSMVFRMSDNDLLELASTLNVSTKTAIQTVAAHEYGHALDPKLQERWDMEQAQLRVGNFEKYASLVMERETVAWALGRAHAPNIKYFDAYNKHNLILYRESLNAERDEYTRQYVNYRFKRMVNR